MNRIIITLPPQKATLTANPAPAAVENGMVRFFLSSLLLALALTLACSPKRAATNAAETSGSQKYYTLTGQILSLDPKAQTANINAAAIPNYMDAMAMDYPIQSKSEFSTLHVGDKIKATLNVSGSGDDYYLSNVQKQGSGSK